MIILRFVAARGAKTEKWRGNRNRNADAVAARDVGRGPARGAAGSAGVRARAR